jgi:16S rRNA (uracil1498-N3)-methyltransferase
MTQALDHAVQGGATDVTPLSSRYTIAKWNEKKSQRAGRVMHAAMKQCGRGLLPRLHPVKPYQRWCIEQAESGHVCLLFDQEGGALPDVRHAQGVSLAVGCEGGFSDEERTVFLEHGFQPVRMGPRRLRAEVAVPAAFTTVLGGVETPAP